MKQGLQTHTDHIPVAVVRGVGDVGSAVAWELYQAGFAVICHENRQPRTIRRRMAFCDALWTGEAELADVKAARVERLEDVLSFAKTRKAVALYAGPFEALMSVFRPTVLVDARIQKYGSVEMMLGQADLSIGVGPSFQAQEHVDLVIESCWGETLGQIIEEGGAAEPVPTPPKLNGLGWERFIRSEQAGRFESDLNIGDYVELGSVIGTLDGREIEAPISGYLRGLLYPGLSVLKGEKLCEIDPRENQAHFVGLAERPQGIAQGVMMAVHRHLQDGSFQDFAKSLMNQDDLILTKKDVKMS